MHAVDGRAPVPRHHKNRVSPNIPYPDDRRTHTMRSPPPPLSSSRTKPNSKQICEAYAGDKNYITVNGDHNSPRPSFLFDSVYIFLQNYLQVPLEWGLDRENTVMGFPPWHYASGGRSATAAAAAAMYGAAAAAGTGSSGGGDLDPDFADFDWDGVGVDDVGVDGIPSVGMTRARQAEFQTALFHMLAQVCARLSLFAAAPEFERTSTRADEYTRYRCPPHPSGTPRYPMHLDHASSV